MNYLLYNSHKSIKQALINFLIILLIIFKHNFAFASLEQEAIKNIKSYIQDIQSVAISFEQSDMQGARATGILIINKPYRFRVNYFKPFPLLIVGNKNYVSVYDYEMENLSRISAEENIFNFLFIDQINFDNQIKVLSVKEEAGHYKLGLSHLDSGKISEILFNKSSRNIETIKIIEENNIITFYFKITKKITNINNKLFMIKDPDIFGKPEYLDKQHLEKNYQ